MTESALLPFTIDINGTQLHGDLTGAGDSIVLVHSGITNAGMWDPQIEAFVATHRVVRYDMRGFGRSPIPPESFAHHEDLFALFEALKLGPSIVVGASYGGEVAAAFAIEHPELVRALVLVNTLAGLTEPSEGLRSGWRETNAKVESGDISGAVEVETRRWVDGPHRAPNIVDSTVRDRVTRMNTAIFAQLDEIEAADERELDPPIVERLDEISVPTLIVVGELDQPDAIASANVLASGIGNARLQTMTGVAHLPSMERPHEFNQIVRAFISTLHTA